VLVKTTSQSGGVHQALYVSAAVVVPCFNAGHRVRSVVENALQMVSRVILVDDGSTDGATEGLRDLPVNLIRFERNRGKGAALLAGFKAALDSPEITCVVVVDADGQHDPHEIPALYGAFVEQSADLIIGARTFDPAVVPWRSRFGNKLTVAVTKRLFGQYLPDTQSGFRLLARPFAESLFGAVPEGRYETEMAIIVKAIHERRKIVSVPIRTIYESGNVSSHFRKIRDSLRIYRVLLRAALRRKRV
jgi:glycosyltransferase involved in cell wall biosynthesis